MNNASKYIEKATPNPEKGRLNFYYTLDTKAISNEMERAAATKHNAMRTLAVMGGRSPLTLLERAVAGEIVGAAKKEFVKESCWHGFIEEIRTISSGHPLR